MIFEQLNENILLDNKVVFTLKSLRDYVDKNEYYPNDLAFDPMGSNSDYWGRFNDYCIDKWLDDEDNFQSACKNVYNKLDGGFQSANRIQETRKVLS